MKKFLCVMAGGALIFLGLWLTIWSLWILSEVFEPSSHEDDYAEYALEIIDIVIPIVAPLLLVLPGVLLLTFKEYARKLGIIIYTFILLFSGYKILGLYITFILLSGRAPSFQEYFDSPIDLWFPGISCFLTSLGFIVTLLQSKVCFK